MPRKQRLRENETVHVHMRFAPAEHEALAKVKDDMGLTWEEAMLVKFGILKQ